MSFLNAVSDAGNFLTSNPHAVGVLTNVDNGIIAQNVVRNLPSRKERLKALFQGAAMSAGVRLLTFGALAVIPLIATACNLPWLLLFPPAAIFLGGIWLIVKAFQHDSEQAAPRNFKKARREVVKLDTVFGMDTVVASYSAAPGNLFANALSTGDGMLVLFGTSLLVNNPAFSWFSKKLRLKVMQPYIDTTIKSYMLFLGANMIAKGMGLAFQATAAAATGHGCLAGIIGQGFAGQLCTMSMAALHIAPFIGALALPVALAFLARGLWNYGKVLRDNKRERSAYLNFAPEQSHTYGAIDASTHAKPQAKPA